VLLLLIALKDNMGLKSQHIILLLASLTILVGGLTQKVGIVLRANYLRGIVIGYPKNNA
jgi:hypothetical protein